MSGDGLSRRQVEKLRSISGGLEEVFEFGTKDAATIDSLRERGLCRWSEDLERWVLTHTGRRQLRELTA